MIQAIVAGIFGLFFGSFLNVIDLRFGKWRDIATTRSHCPHCHYVLGWYDLIPVFSFMWLRGKCRKCHHHISWQYPIIELSTGIVTGLIWYINSGTPTFNILHSLFIILFSWVLIVMVLQDTHRMEVSDALFIAALVLSVLARLAGNHQLNDSLLGILEAAGLLLALVLLSRETWMGWGDVFLAVPIGIVLGHPKSILWLYLGFMIGALWGIALLVIRLKKRRDPVPFIPILALCFLITYLWGDVILQHLWQWIL